MPIKVTVIGAGSIGFTRMMVRDILTVPELQDSEFAFTDISEQNLDMVYKLCKRDIESAGLSARISATTDRRKALEGANYVYSFVRVGGLEAFTRDIDIPLKYGVDQCVGDTLGPGGIMYGQRGIPALLEFCKDMSEVSAPNVLFMNYSNPMAMLTWACNKYGYGVRTIGLCHGVTHTARMLAKVLNVPYEELDYSCCGINHQTWYLSLKHKGVELKDRLLEAFDNDPETAGHEKVRVDMLRRFGYFSTESNGHLSEYLPWYRKRLEDLPNWIDLGSWIWGETGGYLRVCTESRNWFEHDYPTWMSEDPWTFEPEKRGQEHGSYIIESLETGKMYRGHFNVVNNGVISNLPDDCIIETPCYVDANGISVPHVGELPLGCAAVCNQSVSVQRLSVEAAVHGDDFLLRQAMMLDPLTGAVCTPPEVWQLTDEMLVELGEWLPQYPRAIEEARVRLTSGEVLPTRDYDGVRVHTKTVEEMEAEREESRRLAAAADKGDM